MEWFYSKVIRFRKAIMVAYLLLAVVCGFMQTRVYVDYDILNYLPKDAQSTTAIDFMAEEFGGDIPNTRVVICNVDKQEALEYKAKLEAIDGVISVMWVDSLLPLNMPLEVLPEGIVGTYYKNGNALFSVTVDEDKQLETIPKIYELIGEDNMLCGESPNTVVATINTVSEVTKISIIAIIFLFIVLTLTTMSWVEPFVVMFGLGVAVVINMGTNIIFGKISFVTNSTGMILQLAVSLDYSVFLIHRFTEYRDEYEPEEAMKRALVHSTSSIVSSGLTTVIGFLALAVMKFLLGVDLGLALSKGVAISLGTVLLFMPGVILATFRLMEKTRHRRLLPEFDRLGRAVRKVTLPLCVCFVLIIVPSYIMSTHNSYLYGASKIYGPETRIGSDTIKIEEAFGHSDSYVLMVPRGDSTAEHALIRELQADPRVTSVLSPLSVIGGALPSQIMPDSITGQLQSENYDRIVLSVSVPTEGDDTFDLIEKILGIAEKYYPGEYHLAGAGVSIYDLKNVVTGDMVRVNLLAVIAVFIVLLLTMKNLLLPLILVLTIETAIWVNMSVSYVLGTPLFYISYLIISSIQLGATVDYAILFTERYKENRLTLGCSPSDCIVRTISDTALSIMTSALIVIVMGLLLGFFSSQKMIAMVGMLLSRGTVCSLLAVLFILPGLLMTFDKYVMRSFGISSLHSKKEA